MEQDKIKVTQSEYNQIAKKEYEKIDKIFNRLIPTVAILGVLGLIIFYVIKALIKSSIDIFKALGIIWSFCLENPIIIFAIAFVILIAFSLLYRYKVQKKLSKFEIY